jgi:hypothetical protein
MALRSTSGSRFVSVLKLCMYRARTRGTRNEAPTRFIDLKAYESLAGGRTGATNERLFEALAFSGQTLTAM